MCFAIVACGFVPRCALDESDSAVVRFKKILDLITACEFSVHDVSRVELDSASRLPRFNMPLELGADLGLRLKGPAPQRRAVAFWCSMRLRIDTIRLYLIFLEWTWNLTAITLAV
jgi:hypothetical protein